MCTSPTNRPHRAWRLNDNTVSICTVHISCNSMHKKVFPLLFSMLFFQHLNTMQVKVKFSTPLKKLLKCTCTVWAYDDDNDDDQKWRPLTSPSLTFAWQHLGDPNSVRGSRSLPPNRRGVMVTRRPTEAAARGQIYFSFLYISRSNVPTTLTVVYIYKTDWIVQNTSLFIF